MVTMVDEIYDRNYQAARRDLNAALVAAVSRLGAAVSNTFSVLQRIEYSEPWSRGGGKARSH